MLRQRIVSGRRNPSGWKATQGKPHRRRFPQPVKVGVSQKRKRRLVRRGRGVVGVVGEAERLQPPPLHSLPVVLVMTPWMRVRSKAELSRGGNAKNVRRREWRSGEISRGKSVKLVRVESAPREGRKNLPLRVSVRSVRAENVRNAPKPIDHLVRAGSARKGFPTTSVNPILKWASRWQVMGLRGLLAVVGVAVGPDGAVEANKRANSLPAQREVEASRPNVALLLNGRRMAADNRAGLATKTGGIAHRAGASVRSGAASRVPVEAIVRVVAETDRSVATDLSSGVTDRSMEEPPKVEVGRRGEIFLAVAGVIGGSEESHRRSFTMSQPAPVRWRKWLAG
jgi:hypothetical protein